MKFENIAILTGAGISAESGIATFRDAGGLWANHRVEDVATPEGYRRNPSLVHEFYNHRRRELKSVSPNPAHTALAQLEAKHKGEVWIITQNVDNLHERGGSKNVIHIHGELNSIACEECGKAFFWDEDCDTSSVCPECGVKGFLRPDIVWFGEIPKYMKKVEQILLKADLFISIGTSGAVYPAAGFVSLVNSVGKAHTAELNLEKSAGASQFTERIYGKAGDIVPKYAERLLEPET